MWYRQDRCALCRVHSRAHASMHAAYVPQCKPGIKVKKLHTRRERVCCLFNTCAAVASGVYNF